ncbi:unnamed protein product, partial [Iphiclides podalirius]
MENIRRSKQIALDLIEDTKDAIEGGALSPVASQVRSRAAQTDQLAGSSREGVTKHAEYVKHGKITFNTTAILHHYPQYQNGRAGNCSTRKPRPASSDLNANDRGSPTKIEGTKVSVEVKDSDNNNGCDGTSDAVSEEISKRPVKFAEEKLV